MTPSANAHPARTAASAPAGAGRPARGLHAQLIDALGQEIVTGVLPPGATLDPEGVARQHDVSRTVVREAFRVLADKGLLEARPRRGTVVLQPQSWKLLDRDILRWQLETRPTPELFQHLHEVRLMVEPMAAELAASRRTRDDLLEIEQALASMAGSDDDAAVIVDADLRFHLGLLDATHNEFIRQLGPVIEIGLAGRDRYVHTRQRSIRKSLPSHRAVFDAVAGGDGTAAREAMLALLRAAAEDATNARGGQRP